MRDEIKPPPGAQPAWRDRLLRLFRRRNWRGFVSLYNLLKPEHSRRALRVVTRYGTQFFLTPWDSVDTHVICEGFYESEVLEAIRPFLTDTAVLWVVGANFGLHAITAKYIAPHVQVIAFEPSPSMAARLLEGCELNRCEVALHAYALSDADRALPFFANASGNPGMSTLHPVAAQPYDHRFTVSSLTAARVIESGAALPPTVVILDVEGAETEVLGGFSKLISANSLRAIVFEAPNDFLVTHDPPELHELILSAGFRLRKLDRNEDTGHSLSNFLAVRE